VLSNAAMTPERRTQLEVLAKRTAKQLCFHGDDREPVEVILDALLRAESSQAQARTYWHHVFCNGSSQFPIGDGHGCNCEKWLKAMSARRTDADRAERALLAVNALLNHPTLGSSVAYALAEAGHAVASNLAHQPLAAIDHAQESQ
jgi:hypothetical protein